jgi:phage terminase large subunit
MRPQQREVLRDMRRFNVVLAHRRFGKTYLAIVWLIKTIHNHQLKNAQGHYYAPNYSQAKKIAWKYIKDFTAHFDGVTYNESELRVNWLDKQIQLGSAENPDSSRGIYSDAVILDEPACMAPRMWTEVLRPALSDRKGQAMFIGTPQGRHGLFYDMYQDAEDQPDWYRCMFKASETGIVPHDELLAAQRTMSRAEYLQEFMCSFDAAVRGAYWGETMSKIEENGQITRVHKDMDYPVNTAWDLGINDATAVWFYQVIGNEYRFIDYEEYTNLGLPDIVHELRSKGHLYGKHVVPHDAGKRSLSTGKTRVQTLSELGLDTVMAPKPKGPSQVTDQISVVRQMLPRCWFDKDMCKNGIEALRQYRSEWDELKGVGRLGSPRHDWSSHGADSMRYLANTPISSIVGDYGGEIDYSRMDMAVC